MEGQNNNSSCLENVKFSHCDVIRHGSSRGMFKDKAVATSELLLDSCDADVFQNEEHWKHLINLRDDNLVQYHQCSIKGEARLLVMDLCEGSMLDYCRKNLDDNVTLFVKGKGIDIMWQITCGMDYLNRHKIHHGNIMLENVLFWKRNSCSKRIVVKLAGYGYKLFQNQNNIKDDLYQLGCLYYSAATKDEAKPNELISLESLAEIEMNHRSLALDLIHLLIKGEDGLKLEIATLLRHPLFIRSSDDGKVRLIKDLTDGELPHEWNSKQKLQEWKMALIEETELHDEDFDDLTDILVSEKKDIGQLVAEALRTTPESFTKYIWYLATDLSFSEETNKVQSIEIYELLGEGKYGKVFKCNYTDGDGKRYVAACKKSNTKREGNDMFDREIQTLRRLDHLFVIKYLDVIEKSSKKFIVMELCDGSLKDYFDGKLEGIPKDSLDDKILVSQITLGVAYIHDKGIIHKDLKLENILLKRQSPRLVLAKIADFGFAKELKPGKAEFSETLHPGTESYMAPELLTAHEGAYPASFASDVYALGIIIVRIIKKGDHPFGLYKLLRSASMFRGLVPPELQEFSWDLIDLIVKLTEKEPEKRPEMTLVLRHPYFVLTNDRTKRYFVDKLCNDFDLLSKDDRTKQLKKVFNQHNFQEWYSTTLSGYPDTDDEIEEMSKNLSFFRKYDPEIQADTLYPAKKYAEKIKEAISSDYDANIESQINQMSTNRNLPRYHLYKLVRQAPNLLLPYFWYHLLDLINNIKLLRTSTAKEQKSTQQKQTATVRTRRQSSKTKPFTENTMISEMEWSSLYFEENELIDELWIIKYSDQIENCSEMPNEIIGIVAKCNVTEKVWEMLLNRFGRAHAGVLLHKIVQSNAFNGPEVTKLILQRHGTTEDKEVLALAASDEGNVAAGITRALLEHERDPNAPTSTGLTPIHYAARNESNSGPEIMKLLLERGGNPNVRSTNDSSTPVHWAAANQGEYAVEILKHLLGSGGDYDAVAEHNLKPIHLATMNSSKSAPELLDLLLNNGGIDDINGETGRSLVHLAIFNDGDYVPAILEKLFENGAKPNVGDDGKRTPLHYLVANSTSKQETVIAKILVSNGGNPNAVDKLGKTPVHYAAANLKENDHETLNFLLTNGGSVKIKDKNGFTPIHCALLNTGIHGSKIRELVGVTNENINADLDKRGNTLLHHIVSTKTTQTDIHVQLLLDYGGNPNIQNKLGQSPVHLAVMYPSSDSTTVLQLLLLKGGNPNLLDKEFRCSPVHYVASSLRDTATEEMKILLNNRGDSNVTNKDRLTPLHLAAKNEGCHGPNLTRILLEHGGNPQVVDAFKQTPLELAIRNSNDKLRLEIISQLLKNGGNPNAGNREGSTPVHFAVCDQRNNSLKVLKLMLQYGGNIDKCNHKGITPFVLATRFKYCSPEVKAHILKISRQTRSPETSWLNGIKENIHPKYVQIINLLKKVPVGLFVAIVIILLLYMFLFLYPIFFK